MRRIVAISTWLGALAVVGAPSAQAEEGDGRPLSRIGAVAMIGGGISGFTNERADDFTDTGGSWTTRVAIGTHWPIAFEMAYQGTVNNIDAIGLDSSALLLSNGVDTCVRWNILNTFLGSNRGSWRIEPFLYGGVGYRRYDLINEDFNTSSVRDSDNVGEVPLGGGIAFTRSGLVLDARGSYRIAFDDESLFANDGDRSNLDRWDVSARVGFEF